MITSLLRQIEALGCAVTCEGDRLKLHNPAVLGAEHRERLKQNKAKILEWFQQQEQARKFGWTVYPYGIAYEKQVGRNSWVYLFREQNGKYTAWRGTWREKKSADKEKLIIGNVDFEKAFERATSYVKWFSK